MNRTIFTMRRTILFFTIACILACAGCASSSSSTDEIASELLPEIEYPSEPINPESADFSKTSLALVASMGAGWNLGNTLDATSKTDITSETSWGQPVTTRAMMAGLKASGIKTVRIPVSWHNHVDAAFTVDPAWMARVKEVVDYALDEGLFVIINIHHDNDKAYYYPDRAHEARSSEYVRRVWKQIALEFRNYDEKLIFELLNEPRLVGYTNEWNWNDGDEKLLESAAVIGALEQTALDTIRATASNNSNRYVMITPYVASPWASFSSAFAVPSDTVADKLILSVHAYTPYSFAMEDPGVSDFTGAHQSDINTFMGKLNIKFVEGKNMPVIIGEYGATNKNNLTDREEWFSYFVGKASSYGMRTILWDNGNYQIPASKKYSELYGYYNRSEGTWYFPSLLSAILDAVK